MPERGARLSNAVERLKRRSDFRAAAAGLRAAADAFVVQARRRGEDKTIRVGFTVSRQVGNAVERNRVRRRLRELVRLSAAGADGIDGRAGLRNGHDYVLVGRRAALATPFDDMVRDLEAALGRIHAREPSGTGSSRRDPLHEAGSPSGARKPRRSRKPRREPSAEPPRER